MKIGDIVENAIWLTGDEPEGMCKRYRSDVIETIDDLCHQAGFIHGDIIFTEKRPDEDRVPNVPDHIQGQRIMLLVAEAHIIGKVFISKEGSFVDNLDRKDLIKLRKVTQETVAKCTKHMISYEECDEIIERLGIDVALDTIKTIH